MTYFLIVLGVVLYFLVGAIFAGISERYDLILDDSFALFFWPVCLVLLPIAFFSELISDWVQGIGRR